MRLILVIIYKSLYKKLFIFIIITEEGYSIIIINFMNYLKSQTNYFNIIAKYIKIGNDSCFSWSNETPLILKLWPAKFNCNELSLKCVEASSTTISLYYTKLTSAFISRVFPFRFSFYISLRESLEFFQ